MAQVYPADDTSKEDKKRDEFANQQPKTRPDREGQSMAKKPFYEESLGSTTTTRRCTISMERNWNTTDDYLTLKNSSTKFEDINFPVEDAIFWHDFGEVGGLS